MTGSHPALASRLWSSRVIAPRFDEWFRALADRAEAAPRPRDLPEAHASGPDPDRLLIWGDGPALGYGVASHDSALPGTLARRLSMSTGRGSDVRVIGMPRLRLRSASAALAAQRLDSFDAVLLFLGTRDAALHIDVAEWKQQMRAVVAGVTRQAASDTWIIIMGIAEDDLTSPVRSTVSRLVARHTARLNAATEEVCREFRRVSFLSPPRPSGEGLGGIRSEPDYRQLADTVSLHIASLLDTASTASVQGRRQATARQARSIPQEENARQQAVLGARVRSLFGDSTLERIAADTRAALGGAAALVTIIDDDTQWIAAGAGDGPVSSARSDAFCDFTIRKAGAFVVPDATKDPRFADNPFVTGPMGVRFYAGFPIESPDGFRLGALCVIDTAPRTDFPIESLRDLALQVQGVIAARAAGIPAAADDTDIRGAEQLRPRR